MTTLATNARLAQIRLTRSGHPSGAWARREARDGGCMFAFLSRRLRRWLLLVVGLPVAAWALDRIGGKIEQRWGPSRGSRMLRGAGGMIRQQGSRRGTRRW
jgi:hypothetical protein